MEEEKDYEVIDIKDVVIKEEITTSSKFDPPKSNGKRSSHISLPAVPIEFIDFEKLKCEENEFPSDTEKSPKQNGAINPVPLMCDLCGKSFDYPEFLRIHIETHKQQQRYECEICDESFTQMSHLRVHVQKHENQNFKCSTCPLKFSNKQEFADHVKTHSDRPSFQCNICSASFPQSYGLQRHILTHNMTDELSCSECGEMFSNNTSLTIHKRIHKDTVLACKLCNFTANTKGKMTSHMRVHNGKLLICSICDATFHVKSHLKTHMRIHTGEKPFVCDMCHKSFSHLTTLRRHKRTHTGEKRYQCQLCFQPFAHRSSLKRHMQTHSGDDLTSITLITSPLSSEENPRAVDDKVFTCNRCSVNFNERSSFQIHMRGHIADEFKPVPIFKCGVCSLVLPDFQTLQSHMEVHNMPRTQESIIENKESIKVLPETDIIDTPPAQDTSKNIIQPQQRKKYTRWESNPILLPRKSSFQDELPKNHFPNIEVETTETFQMPDQSYMSDDTFSSDIHSPSYSNEEFCTEIVRSSPERSKVKPYKPRKLKSKNDDTSKSKAYKCEYCSASFSSSAILRSHIITHTGEKPYKCTMCSESFGHRSTRMRHMQIHTGKVSYECGICNRTYSRKDILDKHMMIHY